MQISAESTDLSASGIRPGPPQTAPENHIVNYTGPAETQFLHSVSNREYLPQGDLESGAQARLDASLMASTDTPGSSRTRPVRRTTQSAIDAEPVTSIKPVIAKKIRRPYIRKRMNRQVNIVCIGCSRGNSPSNNLIVLCDGCDDSWHQKCHNPNISEEVTEIPDMDWFCTKCNPSQRPNVTKPSAKKPGRPKKTMSSASQFQYSEEERRSYLSSLPHDVLVQLLLKISTEWPLIPIFPPKSMASISPAAPAFNSIANRSVLSSTSSQTQAPAVQTTPQALAKLTSPMVARNPARISYAEFSESDLTTDDEFDLQSQVQSPVASAGSPYDDYDPEDHRAYPVAGRGFHVPMSAGDLDIMAEDEGYPTFSHSLGGQKQI